MYVFLAMIDDDRSSQFVDHFSQKFFTIFPTFFLRQIANTKKIFSQEKFLTFLTRQLNVLDTPDSPKTEQTLK